MKGTQLLGVSIFILQIIGGFPFQRVTKKPIEAKVRVKEVWGEEGRGRKRRTRKNRRSKTNINKTDVLWLDDNLNNNNNNNNGTMKQLAEKSCLNNKSITNTTTYYQPSTWWKLWSYLVSLSLLCFFALAIYELTFINEEGNTSTTMLAIILADNMYIGISFIVLAHLMKHFKLALNVTNKMYQLTLLTDTMKVNTSYVYYFLTSAIVMTLSALTTIIVNFFIFHRFYGIVLFIKDICGNAIYYISASFTLMFFFTTVYIEKLLYRSVRLSLAKHFYRNFTSRVVPGFIDTGASIYETLSLTTHWISEEVILGEILSDNKQKDHSSEKHNNINNNKRISFGRNCQQGIFRGTTVNIEDGNDSESYNNTQKIERVEDEIHDINIEDGNDSESYNNTRVEDEICDNVTEECQGRKGMNDLVHSNNNSEVQQDTQLLKGTREMLLRIHALHRLLLQYLALPVLLLTFSSLCQSIVSVYFISLSGADQVATNIKTASTSFLYCFPILLFPNITVILRTEVCEARTNTLYICSFHNTRLMCY